MVRSGWTGSVNVQNGNDPDGFDAPTAFLDDLADGGFFDRFAVTSVTAGNDKPPPDLVADHQYVGILKNDRANGYDETIGRQRMASIPSEPHRVSHGQSIPIGCLI